MPDAPPHSEPAFAGRSPLAVVGLTAAAAALHVLARGAWSLAHAAHGDGATARFALAVRSSDDLTLALGIALAAGLVAALARRSVPVALAAAAAPAFLWTAVGDRSVAAVGLLAAAVTGVLVALLAAVGDRRRSPAVGRTVGALGLAVAAAIAVDHAVTLRRPPPVTTSTTIHDLTDGGVHWEVTAARWPDHLRVAMVTPTREPRLDAVDLPTIVLPPPASIEFEVPDAAGPLWLELSAGAGAEVGRDAQRALVGFDVFVDGELRWSEERPLHGDLEPERRAWSVVTDGPAAPGLAVAPGALVELRTRLAAWDESAGEPAPLEVGFGRVRVVRRGPTPMQVATPERPNVVFVVADTQRRDRLSAYGYDRATAPHLERLAARGVLFESAWATSSWTWPATASLFTGRTVLEHGVRDAASAYLSAELTTLAETLRREGYRTAAFSGNPLIAARRNYDQGFEHFDDHPLDFRAGGVLVDGALRWLASIPDERFFLYLHLVDSHDPYRPDPREVERLGLRGRPPSWPPNHENRVRERLILDAQRGVADVDAIVSADERLLFDELYDGATATTDRHLGRVLDALERLGLADSTLVVFTADHGELLFEQSFLGHGMTLREEECGVPLVIAGPGLPQGVRRAEPVSNRHVAPTLTKLLGVDLPTVGQSLDLLGDEVAETLVAGSDHALRRGHRSPTWALREGNEVLWWTPTHEAPRRFAGRPDLIRLFDLAADPQARVDLAAERPERARAMLERLRARLASERARGVASGVGAGDATMEMLRRAGYVEPGTSE